MVLVRIALWLLASATLTPLWATSLAEVERLSEQRRLGEAEAQLQALSDQTDPAAIDLEAARIVLRRGQFVFAEQRMLRWFDDHGARLSDTSPLKQRAVIALAQSRFEQGDLRSAETALLGVQSANVAIRAERAYALAAVYLAMGLADRARDELLPALEPDLPALLRAQLLCYLAYAEIVRGEVSAAGVAIDEALALRQRHAPGSVSEGVAHFFLSHIQAARGQTQAADRSLLTAIERLEAERARQSDDGDVQSQWAGQFAFFYREAIQRAADRGDLAAALSLAQRMRGAPPQLPLLDEHSLLLSYVVHERRTLLLSSFRGELRVADIGLTHAELQEAVSAALLLIAAREHADRGALEHRLAQLYRQLIAPAWRHGSQRVYLQTDGPLHALPFGALIVDAGTGRYLIEETALLRADRMHEATAPATPTPSALWVLGDPGASVAPAPRTAGRLGGASREARAVAELYPQAALLIGDEAREAALRALPAHADVHIAAHMLRHPLDDKRSMIALAPGEGEDGWLHDDEVARYAGQRTLVVLSGCASQRGTLASGGPLSMARAWHRAGAHSVLATLWPVPDAATASMMLAFHQARQQQPDVSIALASAQRDWLARHRQPDWRTRAELWWSRTDPEAMTLPFYWAAPVVSR